MLGTFLLAVVGWIIFRAETIHQAWDYMVCMVTKFQPCMPQYGKKALLYIFVLLLVEWFQREKQHSLQLDDCKGVMKYRLVRWGMYILLSLIVLSLSGVQAEFIYFQF